MKRRRLLALGVAALGAPRIAFSQAGQRVIGLLWTDSVRPSPHATVLLDALRAQGWEAGRNLRVEDGVTLEGYGQLNDSAARLVRAKVDLIATWGVTAATAAFKATREIPIVTVMGSDPVAGGFAASLSRPGGNVTGVVTLVANLQEKGIELLREMVPELRQLGFIVAAGATRHALNMRNAEETAAAMKLKLHAVDIKAASEIDGAVASLAKARVGAVYVAGSTLLSANATRIVDALARHRLPAAYSVERYVDAGGLMVYGPSTRKAFALAATYAGRILKGAKPGELPFEQMSSLELTVNLKTAKAQGLKVPRTILLRADHVVE